MIFSDEVTGWGQTSKGLMFYSAAYTYSVSIEPVALLDYV
jgi:hypothetical protein